MASGPRPMLFLSSCVRGGGAGWSLYYLLKHLDRSRIEPIVVVPAQGIFASRFRQLGVAVVEIPRLTERTNAQRFRVNNRITAVASFAINLLSTFSTIPRLRRLIRSRNVELVHCNNMLVKSPGALAAQWAGVPCVLHVRNVHERRLKQMLYGNLARLPAVRCVLCNSEASSVPYARYVPRKIEVVVNGVDLDEYRPQAARRGGFRAELGVPPSVRLVGFTGHLIPRKGLETLIRAAARVLPERDDVLFVAVGRVPVGNPEDCRHRFEALARREGVADRFRFVGFRTDVRPSLVDFELLVLPSFQEPFGRSIIEAMAVGTPVVASRVGGIPEILDDEREGLLVEPGDPAALAHAIGRILDDATFARRLSVAALERVREAFDVARLSRTIQEVLLEIAARAERKTQVEDPI